MTKFNVCINNECWTSERIEGLEDWIVSNWLSLTIVFLIVFSMAVALEVIVAYLSMNMGWWGKTTYKWGKKMGQKLWKFSDLCVEVIEDAVFKKIISRQLAKYYYKLLGETLKLQDLLPRKHPKALKNELIKSRQKRFEEKKNRLGNLMSRNRK